MASRISVDGFQLESFSHRRWISEKLDGVRGYWNGEKLISRNSKDIMCPQWFVDGLSSVPLDGELWMGRGTLAKMGSITHFPNNPSWKEVKYMIFDLPGSGEPYEKRMELLKQLSFPSHVEIVKCTACAGNDELWDLLKKTLKEGGEGLMAVQPHSSYVRGRTPVILKVKVCCS